MAEAGKWVQDNGCVESDVLEDEEAISDIIAQLRLRKYEVKRFRQALQITTALASGTSPSWTSQSPMGSLCSSGEGNSGGDTPSAKGEDSPVIPTPSPDASPRAKLHRPGLLLPVMEQKEEPETDAECEGEVSAATSGDSTCPMKIPSGLTVKNTFFDIVGGDDAECAALGPTTCPLPTEGWWSGTTSQNSSQTVTPTVRTPAPLEDIGPTPSWSNHNTPSEAARQQSQQSLDAARKMWADATPDAFGPTPDLRHASLSVVGAPRGGAASASRSSHFARLLAAEADDARDGQGHGGEAGYLGGLPRATDAAPKA